jgi:uncharacterized membrane protein YoaK (UPF0700 family)
MKAWHARASDTTAPVRQADTTKVWLLALAFAGGCVDAVSYLGLGRVFTANMTGNTVLLVVAVARHSGADAARSSVALGGFCVGAAVAMLLLPRPISPWPSRASGALLLEMIALVALLLMWALIGTRDIRYELIAIAGVAMGAQSAAVRASDTRGVNTTYMTSTLLNAIAGLVRRARGTPQPGDGPSLPAAAWVTYGLGALAGAFAERAWHAGVVGVPLAIVCVITAAGSVAPNARRDRNARADRYARRDRHARGDRNARANRPG